MSKKAVKHISPESQDRFEEELEGVPENFGSMDDWETEALLKMRKLQKGQTKANGGERADGNPDAAEELVQRKLALYKCVLKLMEDNPKLAMKLGNEGGFKNIMAHVTKMAIHYAAEKEIEPYAKAMTAYLPGARQAAINFEATKAGGFADSKAKRAKTVSDYQAAAAPVLQF